MQAWGELLWEKRGWSGSVQLLKYTQPMSIGVYIAVPCIDYLTMLHVDHVGHEGPECLCKLSESLMAHVRPWNPEVPALKVLDMLSERWAMKRITV